MPGAAAFQLSNPPVLQTVSLLASLELFALTSMRELRGRSVLLTAYLELLVKPQGNMGFRIITPSDPKWRGCMLNLKFDEEACCISVNEELAKQAVVIDYRKPNVLRVAPAPLYNNFRDVQRFAETLRCA